MNPTLRQRAGCWAYERWRTELLLLAPRLPRIFGRSWLDQKNRREKLSKDDRTNGRVCHWKDTSKLTVARTFPKVGGRLLKHVLRSWPIAFVETPEVTRPTDPDVSFVIGVRGLGRIPQFRKCVASLRAQVGASCEIIVVEQSAEPEFARTIDPDVRYIHTPIEDRRTPYNRSWALNVGARAASGRVVVLHDADMVVPTRFASSIAERIDAGLDALRLPRLIFYLDRTSSEGFQIDGRVPSHARVDEVVQNNDTPVAVRRDSYLEIGGHDEAFFGWGAEDNEFMDRLRTLRLGEGAYLPIVHLWHPVAPNRLGDRNAAQLAACRKQSPADRIRELRGRPFGEMTPSVPWHAPAI